MEQISKSISIFFLPVFEIKAFREHFGMSREYLLEMQNPIHNSDNGNERPNQSAFSFSEIIVETEIVDTLECRKKTIT
jgi:hypothetical protein